MFPAETLVIDPSVHARVRVLGRPDLERIIEVPRSAPGSWLITAYLLSIGVEQGPDDRGPGPQLWTEPWNDHVQVIEVPELLDLIEITIWHARKPEAGEQLVCVLDDDDGGPPSRPERREPARWWTDPPSFRLDAVNRELARMFGLVLPNFADSGASRYGFDFGYATPIERLLATLSPVRRLALQAHVETLGSAEPGVSIGDAVAAVTEGIRSLLDRFGPDGVAQDPATGWLCSGLLERTTRELGWVAERGSLLPEPVDALLALARRMRLIRRLRGDVVLTNRGRELIREPERCRREIDTVLREVSSEWSWGDHPTNEAALVLLAIADGSIESVADIPEVLERGRGVLGRSRSEGFEEDLAFESGSAGTDPGKLRDLIGVLAALSPTGGYGSFAPALRPLALAILR